VFINRLTLFFARELISVSLAERKQSNMFHIKTHLTRVLSRKLLLSTVLLAPVLFASIANAGSVQLRMERDSSSSRPVVVDANGYSEHDTGKLMNGTNTIGRYVIVDRFTQPNYKRNSALPFNELAERVMTTTITLIMGPSSYPDGRPATAPHNITLQGATRPEITARYKGYFRGCVTAATNHYKFLTGADATAIFHLADRTLVMTWDGPDYLFVP
jgi:hypothetical protein